MSNLTKNDLTIGDEYRVVARIHGHGFKIGDVVKFIGGRDYDAFEKGSETWYLGPEEVDHLAKESTDRDYVVGLPVCVTVHDDGRVTIDVDLAEIGDVLDNVEGVITDQHEADVSTMSAAAARLGNCLTFTINPAREAS